MKVISKIKEKIKGNNILRNTIILFSGQTFASIIGIVNTMLIIKAIGLEGNGIIAVVMSYANIFNGIFNFQSYNAVIKYGSEALEKKSKYKYKQVLKQAFLQDILTAILAFICGYLSIGIVAKIMKWDAQVIFFIKIYLITILLNITGVFSGILRLHDRFIVIAKLNIKVNFGRLLLIILGIIFRLPLTYYVVSEVLLTILSSFILIYNSIRVLKKEECIDFLKVKIGFDKEFTKFNFYNNIVSTIDLPVGQLVTLIINKFVGVTEVGIYSILLKLGSIISKVTEPMGQTLLPELSKLISKDEINKAKQIANKILVYTNILGGIAILALVIISPIWFELFMPLTFKNLTLFITYMIYIAFSSSLIGIHAFFVGMNLVKYNLIIVASVNIIYLILVVILGIKLGLFGVIISLIIQVVMVGASKLVIIRKNRI